MTTAVGLSLADRLRSGAVPATALAGAESERVLPVLDQLAPLFPGGGLRRGSTVAISGSTSLLLALLAGASAAGSWSAVVGLPTLGALAAAESGVDLERLALVPDPGHDVTGIVAALLDGLDLVVIAGLARVSAADGRRLSARARQRKAVLVPYGPWRGADVELSCGAGVWRGLGAGHGYLRSREVTIRAAGRGAYARPLAVRVLLPGPEGKIAAIPSSVAGPSSVASSGTAAWSGRAPRSSAAVLPVNVVPIQAAG